MVSPALSRREKRDSGLHPNPVVTTNELPESLEITLFQAFFQSMSFHQNHGLDVFASWKQISSLTGRKFIPFLAQIMQIT